MSEFKDLQKETVISKYSWIIQTSIFLLMSCQTGGRDPRFQLPLFKVSSWIHSPLVTRESGTSAWCQIRYPILALWHPHCVIWSKLFNFSTHFLINGIHCWEDRTENVIEVPKNDQVIETWYKCLVSYVETLIPKYNSIWRYLAFWEVNMKMEPTWMGFIHESHWDLSMIVIFPIHTLPTHHTRTQPEGCYLQARERTVINHWPCLHLHLRLHSL
jgi:hypothetical protein